jgi:hypothetical protein
MNPIICPAQHTSHKQRAQINHDLHWQRLFKGRVETTSLEPGRQRLMLRMARCSPRLRCGDVAFSCPTCQKTPALSLGLSMPVSQCLSIPIGG